MAQGMKTLTPTLSSGVRPQDTNEEENTLSSDDQIHTCECVCVCVHVHTHKKNVKNQNSTKQS